MILEVVPTAPLELIIRSYKRLALELHPDRNSKDDATEAFQLVYEVFGAKLILLLIIKLCMLKSSIKARSSLRDIKGRKLTASLRPYPPLYNTKSPLFLNYIIFSSVFYFDSTIRST